MINFNKIEFLSYLHLCRLGFISLVLLSAGCERKAQSYGGNQPANPTKKIERISALDLSLYPKINNIGLKFKDENGHNISLLDFAKLNGVNTIRLRLWHNPADQSSSLAELDSLNRVLKNKGLKLWLCMHYSDNWADPGKQVLPEAWNSLSYGLVKDSLKEYTGRVMSLLQPDIIQIGNEINNGFLHPFGRLSDHPQRFKELLTVAIEEVRMADSSCKIMLHYAGVNNAFWFYNELDSLDFDIIGLSYYPLWHGKDFIEIENSLSLLSRNFTQDLLIAETAYPFTLAWNDWTNNIVGLDEQLILPNYPASPQGQKEFLLKVKETVLNNPKGLGFAYWGGEMIAYRSDTATNGSSWENQALFDFSFKALPAWEAFDLAN